MPSETAEKRPAGPLQEPPKLAEPLPCPRCNSTNTKFCYYNNYNLSQPRHFCKACRRYWTQGGTLRNVPVGGGTRKNSKRSRSSNSSTTTTTTTSSSSTTTSNSCLSTLTHEPESLSMPATANHSSVLPLVKVETTDGFNLNEKGESFCSLMSSQGHGFVDPYVYGSGFVFGFCEMGLGFGGRGVWSYPALSYIGGGGGNEDALGSGTSGCNSWQLTDVGGGDDGLGLLGDGDCLAFPGLAISAPGSL